ncbi:hypothetical protein Mgra_00003016 [Meloidogyne graminicola]|uniref:Protein-tyrosine-phosphatase n=1 Tax=Meloidogyne graminicola TaxID=189291 RepID=A0A8S9ZW58_9BILA|nr:hypothetical protein Mgra_00003016 [Meloidogyne graminicola]
MQQKHQLLINNLALKLILFGFTLILIILIIIFLVLIFVCRKRQKSKRKLEEEKPKKQIIITGGETFKKEEFFVVPLDQQTIKKSQKNDFASVFSQCIKPLNNNLNNNSPSPLNVKEYLDIEDEEKNNLKSIIRVENNQENFKEKKNFQKQNSFRKDSIRPLFKNKNEPLRITINDDSGYEDSTLDPNDFKFINKESPLQMRRFQTNTMEKVQENENERLYGEFECLGQQTMCTLRPRSTTAELPENIRKNRYYDILPFEFNRVKLLWTNNNYGGTNGKNDFINASYININNNLIPPEYIATQGPLGKLETNDGKRLETIKDFWEMIWQEKINCIVMLTQLNEGNKQKCSQYWPEYPGESEQFGNDFIVNFYCVTEDDIFIKRELWLKRKGEKDRKLIQWHFKEWKDNSNPIIVENLLTFIEAIRESERTKPILVHCSAGVGRTGVFIALDILLNKLEKVIN